MSKPYIWVPRSQCEPKQSPPPKWELGESHETKCDIGYGGKKILTVHGGMLTGGVDPSKFAARLVVILNAAEMKP